MFSSFKTGLRSFIWLFIFGFTLYLMFHFEPSSHYKFHLFLPEAQADEIQTPAEQSSGTEELTTTEPLPKKTPPPEQSPPPEESRPPEQSPPSSPSASMSLEGESWTQFGSSISFNVDDFTGAAHLTYPILVPPGRGGVAPNISLMYNSYQSKGWMGVGWNLDMGAIQRSTKRGLNYSANDYVSIKSGSASELLPRSDWGTNY
jgi:hypothetical protein